MFTGSENILVLAAHPDDEVLGCGGTIARLAANKKEINVAFLTDGVSSRDVEASDTNAKSRKQAAFNACEILGVKPPRFHAFPDNSMDQVSRLEIAKTVEKLVEEFQPDTIITHHCGDLNVDHRRASEAVMIACRPQPGHPVKTIASFEVSSSTEWQIPGASMPFTPNIFIDVSDFLARKMDALAAYDEEMRPFPHARSMEAVEHLAKWRGASAGFKAAEAFMLMRAIR